MCCTRSRPCGLCMKCSISHLNVVLQIFKQVVTRLLSSRYQDVFVLLVSSCCDKVRNKLLSPCYKVPLITITELLQVVPTRLIQTVRNKMLRNPGRLVQKAKPKFVTDSSLRSNLAINEVLCIYIQQCNFILLINILYSTTYQTICSFYVEFF